MGIALLEDRVLVRRDEAEEISRGGILIPETVQDKPQFGVVVAVGPGLVVRGKLRAMQYAPGQRVVFGKWNDEKVTVDGEVLVLLREVDILGTITATE